MILNSKYTDLDSQIGRVKKELLVFFYEENLII